MKKFLSLVLALVMTMSLVTISAGAKDFTDADAINYDEAVEVLTAIGVVDGYTDDSFKPGNALNRGQAAKIICNLILGPTTAADLSADTQMFTDVPVDHIFAGYISFCVEEGIVSGYADGSFKPAAPLTHYAFLKMLLGALGYDAETEGYIGGNWSINVAKRALGIGLNKGLKGDFNGIDIVNRETACLYALNTLKATMVEYDAKTTVIVGDASVALSGNLKNVYNDTKTDKNISWDGDMQFAEKYFPKLELESGAGIYGRPTNEWKNAKKEIGAYASIEPTYVYTKSVKDNDVYKDLGAELVNAKDDEEGYDWFAFINGEEAAIDKPVKGDKDTEWSYTGEGTVTEIYVDDEEETVTVVEINYYLGQVTKVKSDEDGEYITVKELSEGADLDTRTFYVEGYEEDDYVVYTAAYDEDEKDTVIGEVVAPETVTVEVTRVQKDEKTGATYLRADGEKYTYTEDEGVAQDHMVYDLDDANVKTHPSLNEDYILYLDPNGYVLAFEKASEKATEYLYVIDADEEMGEWSAKVLLTDGTTQIVEIDEEEYDVKWVEVQENGDKYENAYEANIVGSIFKYAVNDDGEYDLDAILPGTDGIITVDGEDEDEDEQAKAIADIKNGKAYMMLTTKDETVNEIIVDKKTVFVDEENETAYVGYKEVPNIDDAQVAYVVNGKVVVVAFVLDGEIYDTDATYFMLSSDDRESLKYDSKLYWEYEDAYVNGEKTSVIVSYNYDGKAGTDPVLDAGVLYKVKKTVDEDYIVEIETVKYNTYEVNAVGEEAFWLTTGESKAVKYDTDEETIYVFAEYDENEEEWTITEGNLKDMKDDTVTGVAVIEEDEEYAELVYIFARILKDEVTGEIPESQK